MAHLLCSPSRFLLLPFTPSMDYGYLQQTRQLWNLLIPALEAGGHLPNFMVLTLFAKEGAFQASLFFPLSTMIKSDMHCSTLFSPGLWNSHLIGQEQD